MGQIRMVFFQKNSIFFLRQCFKQQQYNDSNQQQHQWKQYSDSNNQQQKQRIKQNREHRITYPEEEEEQVWTRNHEEEHESGRRRRTKKKKRERMEEEEQVTAYFYSEKVKGHFNPFTLVDECPNKNTGCSKQLLSYYCILGWFFVFCQYTNWDNGLDLSEHCEKMWEFFIYYKISEQKLLK